MMATPSKRALLVDGSSPLTPRPRRRSNCRPKSAKGAPYDVRSLSWNLAVGNGHKTYATPHARNSKQTAQMAPSANATNHSCPRNKRTRLMTTKPATKLPNAARRYLAINLSSIPRRSSRINLVRECCPMIRHSPAPCLLPLHQIRPLQCLGSLRYRTGARSQGIGSTPCD